MSDDPDLDKVREQSNSTTPDPHPPSPQRDRQKGREPADPLLVEFVREVAGEGTVDERCSRILRMFRARWGLEDTTERGEHD